mgnify:FL=1
MNEKLITLSEIMKPTHLLKTRPLPKNKSVVPLGLGIIPKGKFVQYNKDVIPYKDYKAVLKWAVTLNTYFLKDTANINTTLASMEIKNLEKKHNVK